MLRWAIVVGCVGVACGVAAGLNAAFDPPSPWNMVLGGGCGMIGGFGGERLAKYLLDTRRVRR